MSQQGGLIHSKLIFRNMLDCWLRIFDSLFWHPLFFSVTIYVCIKFDEYDGNLYRQSMSCQEGLKHPHLAFRLQQSVNIFRNTDRYKLNFLTPALKQYFFIKLYYYCYYHFRSHDKEEGEKRTDKEEGEKRTESERFK